MDPTIFFTTLLLCLLFLSLQKFFSWREYIIPNIPVATGYNFLLGNASGISNAVNNTSFLDYMIENMEKNDFKQFQIVAPGVAILSTCDPEHLAHMFSKDHFEEFVKGEEFLVNFEETLGHGIFAVDGGEWAEKRKVSSYLFSSNSLRHHMSGVFLEHTNKVLETLTEIAEKSSLSSLSSSSLTISSENHIVDLQDLFARYTFDSICTIAFGMEVNSLGGEKKDVIFQRSYDIAQMTNSTRFIDPLWKMKKFFGIGLEGGLKPHVKNLNEYIYNIIDERLKEMEEGGKDRGDMLSLYIEHGKKKEKTFDRQYLRDMVLNFIIAGRDTTAAASMWIIYELSKNEGAERKLLEEIERELGEGVVPSFDILSTRMPYLRSVIYETLRLHPSVPLDGKYAKCDTFLEPGHIPIKKGQGIDYNIYMMNRNPRTWGPTASEFRPERWMKDGKFVEKSEKDYAVFNLKPRGCLGKRMAEFEAGMLVVGLLPKLRFEVVEEKRSFQTNAILFLKDGMRVKVLKREN